MFNLAALSQVAFLISISGLSICQHESVDLIFTDPVYQNVDDYRWLALLASRILKVGGTLFAYYWCTYLPSVIDAMMVKDLVFRWNVFDLKIGTASLDGGQFTRVMTRPALVFDKGQINSNFWLSDVVYSYPRGRTVNHQWSKNPSAVFKWLNMLPYGITLDPFCGGGTIPTVCNQLERPWLAFEINPTSADEARAKIKLQPPLGLFTRNLHNNSLEPTPSAVPTQQSFLDVGKDSEN